MAPDDNNPENERDTGGGVELDEQPKNEGDEVEAEEKKVKRARKKKPEPKEEDEGEEKKKKKSSPSEKDPITPKERPTREKKAVERYALTTPLSRSSGSKSLEIAKGSGTPLKDIPNVAFKLSKRKGDDNMQLLHTILYGKKAKAHVLKRDIGQFSGFVWTDNEEKQRAKLKEKLDKCVKEKLLDFCDVLNIPVSKSTVKKEDLSVKLLEFLESPHATTELLLAEKDQKTKKPKRKTASTESRSSKGTSAEKSAKKNISGEKRKKLPKADEDNVIDDKDDDLENQSHSSGGEEDAPRKEEGDEDTNSEDQQTEKKMTTPMSSSKDNSGAKSGKKSTNTKKTSSEKSTKSPAKSGKKIIMSDESTPSESPSTSKGKKSKKQKGKEPKKEKPVPAEEKSTSKHQDSKSAAKDQGKKKVKKPVKSEPTNEDLHAEAVNILKVVDFNTATLSDILRQLGTHFGLDLMHRKAEVKSIITDVIENMSNPGDDEEDEDSGAEDSGEQ